MKNPIRGQKCLYKYLNEKRIEALLGARGSDKKKMWMVGQFVTIEQENLRQLIQGNMARINTFHHRLNEAMVKRGYDVSKDNIDLELYSQKN